MGFHQISFDLIPIGGFAPRTSYYAILGSIYSFFDDKLSADIVSIKHHARADKMTITLTFSSENSLHLSIEKLFTPKDKFIISKREYKLHQVDLRIKKFEPGSYPLQNKYICNFYSPTYVNKGNINILLPVSDIFLMSVWRKISCCYNGVDEKTLKEILRHHIYLGYFDICTKRVEIKGGIKAGVTGFATYYTNNIPESYSHMLADIFAAIPFVGIGGGTRLGLGNCGVKR